MAEILTISKKKPAEPALNYAALREEGLKYIEGLARKIWTDYNVHDPGITILELLCYAITDLGYRTSYPIEDILTDREDNLRKLHAHFLSAARVLPTRPLTVNDYRRLLIDVQGVKNAWLEPAELSYHVNCEKSRLEAKKPPNDAASQEIHVKGLYNVLLELEEEIVPKDKESTKKVVEQVKSKLHENRNLCEDFLEIKTVDQRKFILCAEIDLTPEADVALTEAKIFHAVQNYFTPPVRFYTLAEMFAKGKTADEIFEGPLPEKGFVDPEEVEAAGVRKEIRLSDVIQTLMQIEGVKAVKDIIVTPLGEQGSVTDDSKWVVSVWKEPGPMRQPVLDTESSRIVYYKDLIPFQADDAVVADLLEALRQKEEEDDWPGTEDIPIPEGEYRDIQSYYSFQNDLPKTYGIGKFGLPDSASAARKAQAKQLKGYLLFFDQVLANYFCQLAHIKELFSPDEGIGQTYFTQVVSGVTGTKDLYADPENLPQTIQAVTENKALFLERRNEFLDHLLARFAEDFNEYAWTMYALDRRNAAEEALRAKLKFLQEIETIGCERAKAFNILKKDALWDTTNVSGMAHRLARLLGIRNYRRRNLVDIGLDIYEERDKDEVKEYRFRVIDETGEEKGKILLSSSWKHLDPKGAMEEMREALSCCLYGKSYDLKITKDGRFYFNVVDETGDVIARRIEYFGKEEDRDEAVRYLIDLLHEKYSDEGFFIVEHILLRPVTEVQRPDPSPGPRPPLDLQPETSGELRPRPPLDLRPDIPAELIPKKKMSKFFPICVEPDCAEAEFVDPYSFRITVVLPAWPRRFSDIEFRRFVEKTIRLETPAHIMPRICWVDQKQMQKFEKTYQRWLKVHYGQEKGSKTEALDDLIDALSNLRSVYDEATLAPCDAVAEKPPFILDKTILGTKD